MSSINHHTYKVQQFTEALRASGNAELCESLDVVLKLAERFASLETIIGKTIKSSETLLAWTQSQMKDLVDLPPKIE